MSRPPATTRRAAALLVVLAAVVLVVTAAVPLVRVAATEQTRRRLDRDERIAVDLLVAAEEPIRRWLEQDSATAVTPAEATEPMVALLHDAWASDGTECGVRITAWDQCGMTPDARARAGSPVRLTIQGEVMAIVDRVRVRRGVATGLDHYVAVLRGDDEVGVFPEPPETEASWFGGVPEAEPRVDGQGAVAPSPPFAVAVGGVIATHNPGSINVNTAPLPMVQAAMRRAGRRGVYDLVAASRAAGETIQLAGLNLNANDEGRRRRAALTVVTSSPAWAFRIDTRAGLIDRSWWAVYTKGNSPQAQWECVQRLAITE